MTDSHLIEPYGGQLASPIVAADQAEVLKRESLNLPSLDLDWRQLCDLEMLLNGAYSPLSGYMGQVDYDCVLERLELSDGMFWPSPVSLLITAKQAEKLKAGERVALRDAEGFMLAVLTISDLWPSDPEREHALLERSPVSTGVDLHANLWHVGGTLEAVALPQHHDFAALRLTPAELRSQLVKRGWRRIVGYLARQAIHRPQFQFCLKTAIEHEANLLLLPYAGGDLTGNADYFSLVRSIQAIMRRFPAATSQMALLPASTHGCSPRDRLLRAIIARNYGCTHLVVGGEHEGDGALRRGQDAGQDYGGLNLVSEALQKLDVTVIPFPRMVYVEERAEHMDESGVPAGSRVQVMAGSELMRRLKNGLKIPDWCSFPEVIAELQRAHPPKDKQGFTVFFTGLSGAGKSTIARALGIRLMEMGSRPVSLLDGDIVRRHLSSELGFSREHRDINVRRIGFVASEITKNRGVAICAPIAPYRQTRRDVRAMIEAVGGFIEVHVATPIETCESRDRKGLYAKARAGLIPEFTGVSDPYEVPEHPEIAVDTTDLEVDEAIQRILLKLEHEGYLR
ncbi:MAG TPA: bifunctional sulfate adenylyltransferase/adenylylsulfate kinase [Thiobacillaceae bacterium]|nr:bifunctional sulfate adenylyltransferase/adenylylsulfate kinase [Thiobacillaceae bacterium]